MYLRIISLQRTISHFGRFVIMLKKKCEMQSVLGALTSFTKYQMMRIIKRNKTNYMIIGILLLRNDQF